MATKKAAAALTTDPNALYQAIAQAQNLQVDPNLMGQYTGAVQGFNQGTQASYLIPDQLKSYLGGISPQFTQNKEQVLAQFSDPKSALFISNPFARMNAAQAAGAQQKQSYNEILQGVQNMMGLGLEQKKQQVQGYQSNVEAQQQAIKDRQTLLQQQFSNSLSLASNARANASAGDANNGKFTVKFTNPSSTPTLNFATGKMEDPSSGGAQYLKDGVPITPFEFAQGKGMTLDQVLAPSPNKNDQQIAAQIKEARANGHSEQDINNYVLQTYPWLAGR
jgi:hypothetical protein